MKQLEFKNFTIKFTPSRTNTTKKNDVVLFLHGFPAEAYEYKDQEKNIDIAKRVSEECLIDTVVTHYKGLGDSRYAPFSFIDTLKDSLELFQLLQRDYKRISIFAHSWGGYIALNLLDKADISKIDRVFLHAPLSVLPTREIMIALKKELTIGIPDVFDELGYEFYFTELEKLRKSNNPYSFLQGTNLLSKIRITQSQEDVEVPAETSLALAHLLKSENNYTIENTDHGMNKNREHMIKLITEFFK